MITQRIGTEVGLMANRVRRKFRNGAHSVTGLQNSLSSRGKRYIRHTDYLVHENAWKLIGGAAAVALVAGFFLARRFNEVVLEEDEALLTHESGEERKVKVKKRSNLDIVKSLLPFALFLLKARKERKAPVEVEITRN